MAIPSTPGFSVRCEGSALSMALRGLFAATSIVLQACDPGVYIAPSAGIRHPDMSWHLQLDSLHVETHKMGGLSGEAWLLGRFVFENRSQAPIVADSFLLSTRAGDYPASVYEVSDTIGGRTLIPGPDTLPPGTRRMRQLWWEFDGSTRVGDVLECPCRLSLRLGSHRDAVWNHIEYQLLEPGEW